MASEEKLHCCCWKLWRKKKIVEKYINFMFIPCIPGYFLAVSDMRDFVAFLSPPPTNRCYISSELINSDLYKQVYATHYK